MSKMKLNQCPQTAVKSEDERGCYCKMLASWIPGSTLIFFFLEQMLYSRGKKKPSLPFTRLEKPLPHSFSYSLNCILPTVQLRILWQLKFSMFMRTIFVFKFRDVQIPKPKKYTTAYVLCEVPCIFQRLNKPQTE